MRLNLAEPLRPRTLRGLAREMRKLFPPMTDLVPETEWNSVQVTHPVMTLEECEDGWHLHGYRNLPGPYCQLNIHGVGWMHDTLEERLKNRIIVRRATGDVLIGGLGLGMILHPILAKPEVRSVRVLENNADVAAVILPSLDDIPGREKLTLEMVDAAHWQPPHGERFDAIWLDCIAWFSYDPRFLAVVERWFSHYMPFLREPRSYIGHWAADEVMLWLQGRGYGPRETVHVDRDLPWVNPDNKELLAQALALAPGGGGS